MSPYKEKNF